MDWEWMKFFNIYSNDDQEKATNQENGDACHSVETGYETCKISLYFIHVSSSLVTNWFTSIVNKQHKAQ